MQQILGFLALGYAPCGFVPGKGSSPPALQDEIRDCHLDFDRLLVARGPAQLPPASPGPPVPSVCPFFPLQGHGCGQVHGDIKCDL